MAIRPAAAEPRSLVLHLLGRAVAGVQANLLAVMAGVYLIAGVSPGFGLALKHWQIGALGLFHERPVPLSATNILLSSMLFTAGLGVRLSEVRHVARRPLLLVAGVLVNAIMPVIFLAAVSLVAGAWPETDESQSMLVGLALIGAMPVAGGASVWTQNADGNVSLTVGLVLASTVLSPLSIPLALRAVSHLTIGDYSEDLAAIAADGTITFSLLSVVVPCCLGIATRHAVGDARVERRMPLIKALNLVVLLTLSYSNASGAMHAILADLDLDMLALMFLVTAIMCLLSFYAGYRIALQLGADSADVTSLTFGVGMNNSSASSVLAGSQLADHPLVLVPILAYGMLQKVLAGAVDIGLRKRRKRTAAPLSQTPG